MKINTRLLIKMADIVEKEYKCALDNNENTAIIPDCNNCALVFGDELCLQGIIKEMAEEND